MDIGSLRVRITIQKNETEVDRYRNHTSVWKDYFTCWATASASGRSIEETHNAASTQESDLLDFTVRYSSETAAITSKGYRILVGDKTYNITSIDEMGFKHNSRKFHTKLESR